MNLTPRSARSNAPLRLVLQIFALSIGAGAAAQGELPLDGIPRAPEVPGGFLTVPAGPGASPGASPQGSSQWMKSLDPEATGEQPAGPLSPRISVDRERVYAVEDAGGTWVRGKTFKAFLSGEGLKYVPFLGAQAPEIWPVSFRLASLQIGQRGVPLRGNAIIDRDGSRWDLNRGGVIERYDVALDSIQQSFVLPAPKAAGEVVLEVLVETDLRWRQTESGFEFRGPDGGVNLSHAIALDDLGVLGHVPMERVGDRLRFTVPKNLASKAQGTLVVDPFVTTFPVEPFSTEENRPDVSYTNGIDAFHYVFEDRFALEDTDIYRVTVDPNGVVLGQGYLWVSDTYERNPSIASMRVGGVITEDKSLVACSRSAPAGLQSQVVAKLITGAAMTHGPELLVGEAAPGWPANQTPDVGGSKQLSGTPRFIIAWERVFSSTQSNLRYRVCDQNGNLNGVQNAGSPIGSRAKRPKVSHSSGDPSLVNRWVVAYYEDSTDGSDTDSVVIFSVRGDGLIPFGQGLNRVDDAPLTHIYTTPYFESTPVFDVSEALPLRGLDPTAVLLVRPRDRASGGWRMQAKLIRNNQVVGVQELDRLVRYGPRFGVLSASIATTSNRFVIAHLEPSSAFFSIPFYVYTSTWDLGTDDALSCARFFEPVEVSAATVESRHEPAIASRFSGGFLSSQWMHVAWSVSDGSDNDIGGGLFAATSPASIGVPYYCNTRINSAGATGMLHVRGDHTTTNSKVIHMTGFVPMQTGFLHVSGSAIVPPQPAGFGFAQAIGLNAQGHQMCVTYGHGVIPFTTDAAGTATIILSPTAMPQAAGLMAAIAGQEWSVQALVDDPASPTKPKQLSVASRFVFD